MASSDSTQSGKKQVLVVLQLNGGNDFMNTLVPYTSDIYRDVRPTVGVKPEDVLPINDRKAVLAAAKNTNNPARRLIGTPALCTQHGYIRPAIAIQIRDLNGDRGVHRQHSVHALRRPTVCAAPRN